VQKKQQTESFTPRHISAHQIRFLGTSLPIMLKDVHDLQNLSRRVLTAAPQSVGDFRTWSKNVVGACCHWMIHRASTSSTKSPGGDDFEELLLDHGHHQRSTFWIHPTAFWVYALLILSIVTRRPWILHGISLLLVDQMLQVVIKWLLFALDDRELQLAGKYVRGWLRLILEESEKTLTSKSAVQYVMAFSLLKSAPTGVSYFKFVVRYKMKLVRTEFLREGVGKERLSLKRNSMYHVALQNAKKVKKNVKETLKKRSVDKFPYP